MPPVGNGFRYPFDARVTMEPWREKLGGASLLSGTGGAFEEVVAKLTDRDRALEDALGTGRWLSYTPVLTAAVVNPTLGTGHTAEGSYTRFGRTIIGSARFAFGTGGGAAAGTGTYSVSLPTARQQTSPYSVDTPCGSGYILDSNTAARHLIVPSLTSLDTTKVILLFTGTTGVVTDAAPFVWAAGDRITFNFIYDGEIA